MKLRAATALSAIHILTMAPRAEPAQNPLDSLFVKRGKPAMDLHKPSQAVFLIAVGLAVMALIGFFLTIPILTQYQFWLALAGLLLLALGCIL